MPVHPADEPDDHGEHAAVAARLHAALTAPALDPAVRARHLQAVRERAATLPTPPPTADPGSAPAPGSAPVSLPGLAPAPAGRAPVLAPRRGGRRLATATAATGLVLVMGASGAVAASHHALPGDTLYPVKAASEQVVLAASWSTDRSVDRHLTYAQRRLDEARNLVAETRNPALVGQAITAHARLMARAGDLAEPGTDAADRVDAATVVAARQLDRLLAGGLPDSAADQARAALEAATARLEGRPGTPSPVPPVSRPTPEPRGDSHPDEDPRVRPEAPAPRPEATTPRPGPPPPGPTRPGTRPAAPTPAPPAPGPPATPGPRTSPPATPRSAPPAESAPGGPATPGTPEASQERAPEPPDPVSPPRQSSQQAADPAPR